MQTYLKTIHENFGGFQFSFEESLMPHSPMSPSPDCVLASTIWRSVYGMGWGFVDGTETWTPKEAKKGIPTVPFDKTIKQESENLTDQDIDRITRFPVNLERLVIWCRRELIRLDEVEDDEVLFGRKGEILNFRKP
jgi:hypothetical protein